MKFLKAIAHIHAAFVSPTIILFACIPIIGHQAYRKVPNFWMPEIFTVIYLKFKQRGQTLGYIV